MEIKDDPQATRAFRGALCEGGGGRAHSVPGGVSKEDCSAHLHQERDDAHNRHVLVSRACAPKKKGGEPTTHPDLFQGAIIACGPSLRQPLHLDQPCSCSCPCFSSFEGDTCCQRWRICLFLDCFAQSLRVVFIAAGDRSCLRWRFSCVSCRGSRTWRARVQHRRTLLRGPGCNVVPACGWKSGTLCCYLASDFFCESIFDLPFFVYGR